MPSSTLSRRSSASASALARPCLSAASTCTTSAAGAAPVVALVAVAVVAGGSRMRSLGAGSAGWGALGLSGPVLLLRGRWGRPRAFQTGMNMGIGMGMGMGVTMGMGVGVGVDPAAPLLACGSSFRGLRSPYAPTTTPPPQSGDLLHQVGFPQL
eukprot:m51a1_g5443 hypothetical protein (154) ;mRNA; r:191372-192623